MEGSESRGNVTPANVFNLLLVDLCAISDDDAPSQAGQGLVFSLPQHSATQGDTSHADSLLADHFAALHEVARTALAPLSQRHAAHSLQPADNLLNMGYQACEKYSVYSDGQHSLYSDAQHSVYFDAQHSVHSDASTCTSASIASMSTIAFDTQHTAYVARLLGDCALVLGMGAQALESLQSPFPLLTRLLDRLIALFEASSGDFAAALGQMRARADSGESKSAQGDGEVERDVEGVGADIDREGGGADIDGEGGRADVEGEGGGEEVEGEGEKSSSWEARDFSDTLTHTPTMERSCSPKPATCPTCATTSKGSMGDSMRGGRMIELFSVCLARMDSLFALGGFLSLEVFASGTMPSLFGQHYPHSRTPSISRHAQCPIQTPAMHPTVTAQRAAILERHVHRTLSLLYANMHTDSHASLVGRTPHVCASHMLGCAFLFDAAACCSQQTTAQTTSTAVAVATAAPLRAGCAASVDASTAYKAHRETSRTDREAIRVGRDAGRLARDASRRRRKKWALVQGTFPGPLLFSLYQLLACHPGPLLNVARIVALDERPVSGSVEGAPRVARVYRVHVEAAPSEFDVYRQRRNPVDSNEAQNGCDGVREQPRAERFRVCDVYELCFPEDPNWLVWLATEDAATQQMDAVTNEAAGVCDAVQSVYAACRGTLPALTNEVIACVAHSEQTRLAAGGAVGASNVTVCDTPMGATSEQSDCLQHGPDLHTAHTAMIRDVFDDMSRWEAQEVALGDWRRLVRLEMDGREGADGCGRGFTLHTTEPVFE